MSTINVLYSWISCGLQFVSHCWWVYLSKVSPVIFNRLPVRTEQEINVQVSLFRQCVLEFDGHSSFPQVCVIGTQLSRQVDLDVSLDVIVIAITESFFISDACTSNWSEPERASKLAGEKDTVILYVQCVLCA